MIDQTSNENRNEIKNCLQCIVRQTRLRRASTSSGFLEDCLEGVGTAGTGAAVVVERLRFGFVVCVWLGVDAVLEFRRTFGSAFGRRVPGLGCRLVSSITSFNSGRVPGVVVVVVDGRSDTPYSTRLVPGVSETSLH